MHFKNPLTDYYLTRVSKHKSAYRKIHAITGFVPRNIVCYLQSLRHQSAAATVHENGSRDSNERLEYLGDSVINTVVADYLFKKYPFKSEGFLTEMRSKIVSRESLNELAMKLGLNHLVNYDRKMLGAQLRNTIFGNALEAFIGAIYLDRGYSGARKFILHKLITHIDVDKLQITETNFKGRLIEWAQKNMRQLDFETEEIIHNRQKLFNIKVFVDKKNIGESENLSKKKAEQMAAQKALETLQAIIV